MAAERRLVYIENAKVLDDSGTVTIDIDLREPIAQLEVYMKADNGTTSNTANHLHDCFSKIELVDGAEVLWSTSAIQGQAVNFYEMETMPVFNITEWASDGFRETVMLNFGRSLKDREYAFLADRFLNPQMKITWNLAAVRAVGVTGFTSGTGRLSVIARTNPDAVNARGFLMTKELESWTTAASGEKVVDLPRDFKYRLMVVRSYEAGNDFRENISNLKLTCDQDAVVIFNTAPDRLSEINHMDFGPAYEGGKIFRANDATVYTHIMELLQLAGNMRDDYVDLNFSHYWSGNFLTRIWNYSTAGYESTAKRGWYLVNGQYFHSTLAWPFGDMQNPDEWFNPSPYGSIKLKCTEANAGAAASVVIQQERLY
jgi:hypothetical protein